MCDSFMPLVFSSGWWIVGRGVHVTKQKYDKKNIFHLADLPQKFSCMIVSRDVVTIASGQGTRYSKCTYM
jgi:hypothetical protein